MSQMNLFETMLMTTPKYTSTIKRPRVHLQQETTMDQQQQSTSLSSSILKRFVVSAAAVAASKNCQMVFEEKQPKTVQLRDLMSAKQASEGRQCEPSSLDKKSQMKVKLDAFRKRTELLLKKHNWKKYFSEEKEDAGIEMDEDSLEATSVNSSVYTNSSFASTVEEDESKLNLYLNSRQQSLRVLNEQNKELSKIDPAILNGGEDTTAAIYLGCSFKSVRVTRRSLQQENMQLPANVQSTPLSTKRAGKRPCQEMTAAVAEEQLAKVIRSGLSQQQMTPAMVKVLTKKALTRQPQSLTFIADLASTSTPTRDNEQPITSTPKMSTHDPVKYHPRHTIRNKHKVKSSKVVKRESKKKQAVKLSEQQQALKNLRMKSKKNKCFSSEFDLNTLKYKYHHQKRYIESYNQQHKAASKIESVCDCVPSKKDLKSSLRRQRNGQQRQSRDLALLQHEQKRASIKRKLSTESLLSNSSANSCDNCNMCNLSEIVSQIIPQSAAVAYRCGMIHAKNRSSSPMSLSQRNVVELKSATKVKHPFEHLHSNKNINYRHSTHLAGSKPPSKCAAAAANRLSSKRKKASPSTINSQPSRPTKTRAANLEISLADLLYTPKKLRRLNSNYASQEKVLAQAPPATMIISTSGQANVPAKIYFV